MILKEDILNLKTRQEIYNFILKYPGLHLREISRRMNFSLGNLRHHLSYLKKHGLISTKTHSRYSRYYVIQKIDENDKEIINLLRQEIPRKIILLLSCKGPAYIFKPNKYKKYNAKLNRKKYPRAFSKKELIELTKYWKEPYATMFHLNRHPTTLDFHLQKLLDADLIEIVKCGKMIKYKLKDVEKLFTFLIIHNQELSEDTVNLFLMWTKLFSPQNIDSISDYVYEILPHPYHA
jgi:DNA-binding transcriptional ArsR family regulator